MLLRPVDSAGDILPVLSSSDLLSGPEAVARLACDRLNLFAGDWWENTGKGCSALLSLQITIKTYPGFQQAPILAAMKAALVDYVNVQKNIGDPVIVPQLYGVMYQAAAAWASTFAITDLVGISGVAVSREIIPAEWNRKITLMEDSGFDFIIE